MLSAIIVSVALLCSVQAQQYDECEQDFEETSGLQFIPQALDDIEGSARPCCLPQQLQGGLYLKSAIKPNGRKPGMGDDVESDDSEDPEKRRPRRRPIFVQAAGCFAVDYGKGRLRVNEVGVTSERKRFNISVIQATDLQAMFIVDWQNNKCIARKFPYRLQQCISPNATLLTQPTFGLLGGSGAGLKVNVYGQKFAMKGSCGGVLTLVTTNKCVPFVVESEVHSRAARVYSSVSYYDEQASISDPSALNPPSFCKRPTETSEDFNDEELPHLIKHYVTMTY